MNFEDVGTLFQNLNIWSRGDQRAPHKPLLLLYALGKYASGAERFIPYSDIDTEVRKLLIEFGPPRKSVHPEYPFWRLQNDGVWEIHSGEELIARSSNTDAKKSELIKHNIRGGVKKEIFDVITSRPENIQRLALLLLDAHFPSSLHQEILDTVGIDFSSLRKNRDPSFRQKVLRAYEFRCAVCDLDMRLDNITICLEAAHIKWFQAGGPDHEDNGLALCVLHHRLFDRGAFTVDANLQILVSQSIGGGAGIENHVHRFHKHQIREPQSTSYFPNPAYTRWHQREVFRQPARE